jgi:hypothetical protein
VEKDPPRILLVWPAVSTATGYQVFRKSKGDSAWGEPVVLPADATFFADALVEVGKGYEYYIRRTATNYTGHGYIYAGIELPLVESRGKAILVVDKTHAEALAPELTLLQKDLVGDGWTVLRHDVPRMSVDPASTDAALRAARSSELAAVKDLIRSDYLADRSNVRSVFLIGHVPVPYSGAIFPDSHLDHLGAWPADVYYGDMTGVWTDSTVTSTNAARSRNHNIPGDGKFDQSFTPGAVELEVGRVDLANMPTFPLSEVELLRQYLNKDHAFRHRRFRAQARGLINDNLGVLNQEVPGVIGWRNFAPLFGPENTSTGRWLSVLPREDYLWAYGAGAGTYSKATAVASTAHLLAYDFKVVFTMLLGSYFGDWDTQDNLLRAQLGATTFTLTSAWVGRPNWYFHHMALGETIGFSTRLSQSNTSLYQGLNNMNGVHVSGPNDPLNTTNGIHIALMGDPTLRLHPVAPPSDLLGMTNETGGVSLSWTPSADEVLGYNVYRAPSPDGPFSRLNDDLIEGQGYTDDSWSLQRYYMVRAVKLETSASGTYFNASQGVFAEFAPPTHVSDSSTWAGREMRTWTMNDVLGSPGSTNGWDLLAINGSLSIAATETSQFGVRIISFQSDNTRGTPANFNKDLAYSWPILTASGSIVGFDPQKINLDTSEFSGDLGGGVFSLALSDDLKTLNLVFMPNHAPEAERAVFSRPWDSPLRIEIAELLDGFTRDADGDSRAFLQAGASTNGTSIRTDGSALLLTFRNNLPETLPYWVYDVRPYRAGDSVRLAVGALRIAPTPEALPLNAYHAVEIVWQGEPGRLYQVQSRLETASVWLDEGDPILGTGEERSLFQRTSNPAKYYRVILLNQTAPSDQTAEQVDSGQE